MKATKAIGFLGVLIIVAVLTQNAAALPGTAYVDGEGKTWQGYKTYTQNNYNVMLEWKVYKIASNPWSASVDFPDGDNYVYAYQLFNNTASTKDIGSFSVLDIGGNPITQTLMHETQAVAAAQGVMTDPNPSTEQGEWKWMPEIGFVTAGTRSAYLIYSSVYGPVKGSFIVKTPDESDPGIPEVPEPGTLALLGIASALFAAKRGKKRQAG